MPEKPATPPAAHAMSALRTTPIVRTCTRRRPLPETSRIAPLPAWMIALAIALVIALAIPQPPALASGAHATASASTSISTSTASPATASAIPTMARSASEFASASAATPTPTPTPTPAPAAPAIPPPAAAATTSTPAATPARVVTLNLCADQLVMQLADRSRIAAVTWLARDPGNTLLAHEAATLPMTYGTAEEIVRLHPDLVIAGRFTTRATVALLKRFGYPVMEIDTPESFEQVETLIQQVAAALGVQPAGERLVRDMRDRLARVRAANDAFARAGGRAPVAAFFGSNGVTQGTGTLMDAVIRASGLRNLAADLGVRGYGQLSLERLILARPDVIVLPDIGTRPPSVGQQLLAHPALDGRTRARTLRLPSQWTVCGGPAAVTAVEFLHQAMHERMAPR